MGLDNRTPPTMTLIDRYLCTSEVLEKIDNVGVRKVDRPTSRSLSPYALHGLFQMGVIPFLFREHVASASIIPSYNQLLVEEHSP